METMNTDLVTALKRRFICRPDVKAIQTLSGDYRPVTRPQSKEYVPWSNEDVEDHLAGNFSYGHYLVNTNDECKFIAFDIDLAKQPVLLPVAPQPGTTQPGADPWPSNEDIEAWEQSFELQDARAAWKDRKHPARPYIKGQLRIIADTFASAVHTELDCETAAAYSGNKGVHVYAFTGKRFAADALEGAEIVLDALGGTFEDVPQQAAIKWDKFPIFTIEVFPKQKTVSHSGILGNLMRLPLGKNFKSPKDPTFFIDLTSPLNELRPTDPLWALTEGAKNPWKDQGEW